MPDFLFKRDVFPDPAANNTQNVFQNSIDNPGAMVGRCAELCGTYHSSMNFEVRGVPQDVYKAYLEFRQTKDPATGQRLHHSGSADRHRQTDPELRHALRAAVHDHVSDQSRP